MWENIQLAFSRRYHFQILKKNKWKYQWKTVLLTSYDNEETLILENSFPDNLGVGGWVPDTGEWLWKKLSF